MDLRKIGDWKEVRKDCARGASFHSQHRSADSLLHGGAFLRLALVVESHLGFHPSVNGDAFKTKTDKMQCFKGPARKIWPLFINFTLVKCS